MEVLELYGQAAKTALGFFWKSGWAFVLGYAVSAMLQAFVPKGKLTKSMGAADLKSVSLSTLFGAASSSCSFAALATARSLILKGAHFAAGVAFMFASTNLVIELGILILIFLGWQFLAAEIVGGLILIAISTLLIKATYPREWLQAARGRLEEASEDDQDFEWRKRVKSRRGWRLVGHHFVMEWGMVWEEILIGFTVAGFVAVLVPAQVWSAIFLQQAPDWLPHWIVVVQNAAVAPLVAGLTFIGSMGNIPLATVLNENGVLFAGIMGFIYSDLMVPPLVRVNAKYYGWQVALYIAAIMYVSAVITALILHTLFAWMAITPESARRSGELAQFAIDYTFWLNLLFLLVAGVLFALHRQHQAQQATSEEEAEVMGLKRWLAIIVVALLAGGLAAYFLT
ncbi:MAG TPA: permease [Acidobacteriota bacterium]|nr:permease [Acidobacteriota bacterium]